MVAGTSQAASNFRSGTSTDYAGVSHVDDCLGISLTDEASNNPETHMLTFKELTMPTILRLTFWPAIAILAIKIVESAL